MAAASAYSSIPSPITVSMADESFRTLAWSKSGTIATISADGQYLQHRFLRCNPLDGTWDLSQPTTCELLRGTPGIPLVHLEWGSANIPELAVIDAVGRVIIVSFSISLNHPFVTRKYDTDPIDDANAVVGAHWLAVAPSNQQVSTSDIEAQGVGTDFREETIQYHVRACSQKGACVSV